MAKIELPLRLPTNHYDLVNLMGYLRKASLPEADRLAIELGKIPLGITLTPEKIKSMADRAGLKFKRK